MRAVQVDSTPSPTAAGPEALRWGKVPRPPLCPGEVLIQVSAAGLNRADLLQRQGLYPPPEGASTILGLECSGTVVELGSGVDSAWMGRRVCALLEGGGYGELCAARVDWLLSLDDHLSDVAGAAIPEALATSWLNLFSIGQLKSGETVLVQGASSGIGTTSVQLARTAGCRVIATARSERKRRACLELGADAALDYSSDDLAEQILDLTGGAGVDLILDNVGPSNLDLYAQFLAVGGRVMMIGTQGGREGSFNVGPLMAKQARLFPTSLRRTPADAKAALFRTLRSEAWPIIATGQVLPVIDSVYSFPDADLAHHRLESGDHIGKLVLVAESVDSRSRLGVHPMSSMSASDTPS